MKDTGFEGGRSGGDVLVAAVFVISYVFSQFYDLNVVLQLQSKFSVAPLRCPMFSLNGRMSAFRLISSLLARSSRDT